MDMQLLEVSRKWIAKTKSKIIQNWKSNKENYDKLYAKWKIYDGSFNSWVAKEDIV